MQLRRVIKSYLTFATLIMGTSSVLFAEGGLDTFPPAMSPEQSRQAIHVPKGLKVELVAAEPLVVSPVAIDFAPDGKLWVAEMLDYPAGLKGDYQPGGRVRLLEDTNGDGKYDKSTVFLDKVHFPNGITAWKKGVLICAAPDIIYAEDTNGDGKADVREVVFTGFDSRNWQARVNSLSYGLDNWVHGANGLIGGTIRCPVRPDLVVTLGIRDFRMDPDKHLFELETGGGTQQGRTRDDWGNYFSNQNSELLLNAPLADRYVGRNPYVAPPEPIVLVPKEDPDHLYPASRTLRRFNHPESANRVTSACSPVIYRDDLLGPEYHDNAFMCEPVHNLVTRRILKPLGATFAGVRAPGEQKSEFLASADNWFRPVDLKNGPDGALWVVDMYRMIIEHPKWITADRLARINVRAGDTMGRIYRVVPEDRPARPILRLTGKTTPELVAALDSPGGWQRDTVQFMLVERGDQNAVAPLIKMAADCPQPETRLQALCTLEGLKALTPTILSQALRDSHPGVRRNAVRLCEPFLKSAPELGEGIAALADDADAQVRLQVACTLGEWDDPRAGDAIGRIALANQQEPYIFAAAMSSVTPKNLSHVAAAVSSSDPGPNAPAQLHRDLMTMATAYHNDDVLTNFIASTVRGGTGPYPAWELSAVAALLDGLDQQKTALSALGERLGSRGPAAIEQLARMAAYARQAAVDSRAPLETRLAAVQVLGRSGSRADEQDIVVLGELLSPQTPAVLQEGVVAAIAKLHQPKVADVLLSQWRSVGPAVRSSILDVLISRDEWTADLLDHVEKKQINVHEIDIGRRQQLASLKNRTLADRATKLLAASVDKDRVKVIERYHSALTLHGDANHGRQLFEKTCTVCHRLNDVGHSVGPELVALTDKSPQALLVAMLDPNRAVEQKYVVYTAVTNQGRQYTGILAAETGSSITLLQQENKQTTVLRGELEELSSAGKSLMPEGLEKDFKPQDVSDIMSYVASTGPSRKTFAGNKPTIVTVSPDGTLELNATNCEIYGDSLVYQPARQNLGEWHSPDDRAVWTVDVPKSGLFTVSVHYSCRNDAAGNRFQFESQDQRITSRVEGTGKAWGVYFPVEIGKMRLKEGRQRLTLRAADPIKGTLANVQSVLLIPPE
jgi:putative membrane-bound dehydrogenase-like protein